MSDPTNSRYRYLTFKGNGTYRRFVQAKEDKSLEPVNMPYNSQDTPAHGSYGELLFRPEWRARREEILQRDNHSCVVCSGSDGLQVHHRQYHFVVRQNQFKLPWDYPDNLLITLCNSCHNRGHKKFKVPTINI